jgi:hypothetical protein
MQTYATLKTLRDLGHEVTLINLVHPKIKHKKVKLTLSGLFSSVKSVQFSLFRFLYFGKRTKRLYAIDSNQIPKADFTIVGSDQVWNSDITTKLKQDYFLGFAKNTKRLSYASSFGKYNWEEDDSYTAKIKEELSGFKAVSVRENEGVSISKDVFGVDAVQLLDPTLFCSDYSELVHNKRPNNKIFPFLLVPNSQDNEAICNEVSKALNIPIYHPDWLQILIGSSPQSWLNRIKNSAFIITDSFHGLAFSILFHKQFLVVCADKKKFVRLQSLLSLVKLEDRYVQSYEDLTSRYDIITNPIDYTIVDAILDDERSKTRIFLNQLDTVSD